jgi:hypothetical protein
MVDPYIDQFETIGYGEFAVTQIASLVRGLDPEFDPALDVMRARLAAKTAAVADQLKLAGSLVPATYTAAASNDDPLGKARALLRRAVAYAESRADGEALAAKVLGDEPISSILRRRPTKLAPALKRAAEAFTDAAASLPEHAQWVADLQAAEASLTQLNTQVRNSRAARQAMGPGVQKARDEWLVTYSAAKRLVEAVLAQAGKQALMPLVFDDLAEVQTVAGASAAPEPEPAPAPPAG